jgi:hypothetical protein
MNKLFFALFAGAFALVSALALADDKTPAQPVGQAKQYNGNDPYGTTPVRTSRGTPLIGDFGTPTMTPEEKAAARKAVRAKKQQEASAIAKEADTDNKMAQQQKDEADAAAAKAQPKALPSAWPQMGVPIDGRYREPLPPGGPAQRERAKSNP